MSKKNANITNLKIHVCEICGKRLHDKRTNICRDCLKKILMGKK